MQLARWEPGELRGSRRDLRAAEGAVPSADSPAGHPGYEAYLVRYIEDFGVCFQYRSDAIRFQEVLSKRLAKFSLALEPSKTTLVEFGRFAARHAGKRKRKRPETIYFLEFTLYCTRNRKGNFKVGFRTEKSRLRRSIANLSDLMRRMRHLPVRVQVINLNRVLRGHYG